jgi:hypothetical protein
MIRGSVDIVTSTEIYGWAFSPGKRTSPISVQAILNNEILGESEAGIHRPDLAAAGLGNGNAGYIIKLFRPIDPMYLPFIAVKVDGGDAELPRAPMQGFAEFFSSLYRAHSSAGRHRSVFGGLWTDRTDAAAMLRGKTAAGIIPSDVGAVPGALIVNGLALLEHGETLHEPEWRAELQDKILDFLEQDIVLAPLRAVLEDNPLVVEAFWVRTEETFSQPSVQNPSPSPAECLQILLPFGEGVSLDIVRDSFALPEFTPAGASRWIAGADCVAAAGHGLVDRYDLAPGTAALVGPGTIFRVSCSPAAAALKFLVLPERARPLSLAANASRREKLRDTGPKIMVGAD